MQLSICSDNFVTLKGANVRSPVNRASGNTEFHDENGAGKSRDMRWLQRNTQSFAEAVARVKTVTQQGL